MCNTISLIFRDGVWIIDYYDLFYNITKEIEIGFLKLRRNSQN